VCQHMQQAYPLAVPLVVDVGQGSNWLEAHWFSPIIRGV
jgi:DNA polymerase I-like protein with 3'-5' exonuclease and polymerase domains